MGVGVSSRNRLVIPAGMAVQQQGPRTGETEFRSEQSRAACAFPQGTRGAKAATRYPHLVLDELCAIRGILKARDGYLPNPTASLLPQHFFS